jgi:hypothetical protein
MTLPSTHFAQFVDWCKQPSPAEFKRVVSAVLIVSLRGNEQYEFQGILAYVPPPQHDRPTNSPAHLSGTVLNSMNLRNFISISITLSDPVWIDLVHWNGHTIVSDELQDIGDVAIANLLFDSVDGPAFNLYLQNFAAIQLQGDLPVSPVLKKGAGG